jgi:3-dehydroquinate synthase
MTDTETSERRESVPVSLGARSYEIAIGEGLLARAGEIVAPLLKRPMTAIVTDENVAAAHLAALERALAAHGIRSTAIIMPPGEGTKSFKHLAELCDRLLAAGIERRDRIIAFGGGVIGDLAGFAAAILRRGVDFIQIPTTLLSQVDSSVGGKTGINSSHGKNLIGAFHQPLAVITDISLLNTLPRRELASGYAEVAKYGLLGDAGFFEWLEGAASAIMRGDSQARIHAIRKSCEAKARIVAEDETETGVRALLNLGHTFGHALESATGYSSRLLHGEGVSIGMVQAFRFSERQKLCPAGTAERVASHLKSVGLPVHASQIPGALPPPATLLDIMRQDKKAQGGRLTFILARGIGDTFIAKDVADHDVLDFLTEDLRQR